MPAKAGIQLLSLVPSFLKSLDSRLRGNDDLRAFWLKEVPLDQFGISPSFASRPPLIPSPWPALWV
ncbi:MAG: hypothetical protein CVV18_07210 [Gammaproteobacteria bacterium HGW-Gammaproteobacteria-8]|jgi:hypothetical protein|nr:MAG: hypothetical protein CVV18_07210 [Gammaproteobacteria bacterium HGW-Gammaproteobacteria-8]PKM14988.1 MAG: hypothetical protein CVV12_10955 [Gammaproteobacteria bacterium HGW-Gammaproteobacteria-2]